MGAVVRALRRAAACPGSCAVRLVCCLRCFGCSGALGQLLRAGCLRCAEGDLREVGDLKWVRARGACVRAVLYMFCCARRPLWSRVLRAASMWDLCLSVLQVRHQGSELVHVKDVSATSDAV